MALRSESDSDSDFKLVSTHIQVTTDLFLNLVQFAYRIKGSADDTVTMPVKLLMFADDTTLISLISDGDEAAYRSEMDHLVSWCSMNKLEL